MILRDILGTVGAEADDDRIELFLSEIKGKDITEPIASRREKLASVPSGVSVAASIIAVGDDELISDDFFILRQAKRAMKHSRRASGLSHFVEILDSLTIEEINEPARQWHCSACRGGFDAIALHCTVASASASLHEVVKFLLDVSADAKCVDRSGDLIAHILSLTFNSRKKAVEVMLKGGSSIGEACVLSNQTVENMAEQ